MKVKSYLSSLWATQSQSLNLELLAWTISTQNNDWINLFSRWLCVSGLWRKTHHFNQKLLELLQGIWSLQTFSGFYDEKEVIMEMSLLLKEWNQLPWKYKLIELIEWSPFFWKILISSKGNIVVCFKHFRIVLKC